MRVRIDYWGRPPGRGFQTTHWSTVKDVTEDEMEGEAWITLLREDVASVRVVMKDGREIHVRKEG